MIVHYMMYGMTPCMGPTIPKDWPDDHWWSSDWNDVTCEHCQRGRNAILTYRISDAGSSITCLRCKRTSHNETDVAQHYCGNCHAYHDDIWPPARKWWLEN